MRQHLSKEIAWLLREKYRGKPTLAAVRDIKLLEKGEHIDYVIGFVDFLGCRIDLSKKPFIPRPETEFWVGEIIRRIGSVRSAICPASLREPCQIASADLFKTSLSSLFHSSPLSSSSSPLRSLKVLDIFSGSGCIGVAILKHIPFATVDFAEKEQKFIQQIRINTKLNGIDRIRYRVIRSDIFSNIKGRYDYILANPPYIAQDKRDRVQESVLKQEPKAALFGGKDGLRYIQEFLQDVKCHLTPGGKAYMEFDSWQKPAIAKILRMNKFTHFQFCKDQYSRWRYLVVEDS